VVVPDILVSLVFLRAQVIMFSVVVVPRQNCEPLYSFCSHYPDFILNFVSDLSSNPFFSYNKGPKITNNFPDEGSCGSARGLLQPPGSAEVGCP